MSFVVFKLVSTLQHPGHRPPPWRLVALSPFATIALFPTAARYYAPTSLGYVSLPGVAIICLMVAVTVACMLICPSKPLAAKGAVSILAINAICWALWSLRLHFLHA